MLLHNDQDIIWSETCIWAFLPHQWPLWASDGWDASSWPVESNTDRTFSLTTPRLSAMTAGGWRTAAWQCPKSAVLLLRNKQMMKIFETVNFSNRSGSSSHFWQKHRSLDLAGDKLQKFKSRWNGAFVVNGNIFLVNFPNVSCFNSFLTGTREHCTFTIAHFHYGLMKDFLCCVLAS